MAPSRADRKQIAEDTVTRSPSITASTSGASPDSCFISSQLPPLSHTPTYPNHPSAIVRVVNADAFTAARNLMKEFGEHKTGVLNLASDEHPGGSWLYSLATTQEEALCYSSTLFTTLLPSYYPWPNLGRESVAGIFSPAVVIFKHDLDNDCVDLPDVERKVVSVMTVAAPRFPRLKKDDMGEEAFKHESDLDDLRGKIRLVYRMAGHNGVEFLVLGAMGCGAYRCPPKVVAREMKNILFEDEFKGWFRQVVFAIYSTNRNGPGNFEVFKDVFDGVEL